MGTIKRYMPFITSAMLMWIALYIIFPNYQYYIDPDGTAYLTISRRYAEGHYVQAINGYWSPWSCWLTAILMKMGIAAIPASVIVNTTGATGFLFITQSLFLRFDVARKLQWLLNSALAVFLCCAIFAQSFDDLWECFFLLTALRVILSRNFNQNTVLWQACGAIGALAYFAKAYAFPFFILNTVCCAYVVADNRRQWLKICATAILTMLLISFPWIYALHYKYGIWTTSTAGPLNTSWYLVGHPYWRDSIAQLLPPAYPDSPYYWEDPYATNGDTPHFWSSLHLFGLQFIRAGINMMKLIISMVELSVFIPMITLVALASIKYRNNNAVYPTNIKIVALSFLLFPLGYMLVNFESRYIWYMLPLSLVMADFITKHAPTYITRKVSINGAYLLLSVSLVIVPIKELIQMNHKGYEDHTTAEEMIALNINGPFTSNAMSGTDMQSMARIAYFSGNAYYCIPYPKEITHEQLLKEIRRYHIAYYYYLCRDTNDMKYKLIDEHGTPFPQLQLTQLSGVKIFQIDTVKLSNTIYLQ